MSNSFSGLVRLAGEPESKDVGGTNLINVSLASTTGFGAKKATTWIRGNFWGDRWLKVATFLKKGSLVWVEGEISLRDYTNKDGLEKQSLELRVNSLDLTGDKKDGAQAAPAGVKVSAAQDDSDLPF
jgi:single-strand DNA-binding protein